MKVRKLSNRDAAELRRLKADVETAEAAFNAALLLLPEKERLEEARRAFRDKCSAVSPASVDESFSDDFEYAVTMKGKK